MSDTKPVHISTAAELSDLLSSTTYVLIDFHATWCGPCHMVAPVFEQLSTQHSSAGKFAFAKVDVDALSEVAGQYNVTAMPTFVLVKDGKKSQEMRGANVPALRSLVQKVAADLPTAEKKADGPAEGAKGASSKDAAKEEQETVSGGYTMSEGTEWKTAL